MTANYIVLLEILIRDFYLFIDNEELEELDSNEVIDKNIDRLIPSYLKELYPEEIEQFCKDVNYFVARWQWNNV